MISRPEKPGRNETLNPTPVGRLDGIYRSANPGSNVGKYVRLDRNERVGGLPPWFIDEIRRSLNSEMLTSYPVQDRFHRNLALSLDVAPERLMLTPGSDAGVRAIFEAYVSPGDTVVVFEPSYAMYDVYAQIYGAKIVRVPFDAELKPDLKFLLKSVANGPKLVLLANPNQPTGTVLDSRTLHQLVRKASESGTLAAIDEAYYPFSGTTVLPLTGESPNLLVLRTFSKAAGLAGVRLGYVVGQADIIQNLSKVRSPNDINVLALLCGEILLKNPEIVENYVNDVNVGAGILAGRTKTMGLSTRPVTSNFMLVKVGDVCSPKVLVERLKTYGYLVKGPFTVESMADYIRVTLGPSELMKSFSEALESSLREAKAAST